MVDVSCDRAVCEGDRFVLEVDAAALQSDAGGSRQYVVGHVAVLEEERSAGWAVGVEAVEDATTASAAACPAGIDGVAADGAVAQRGRAEGVDAAAPDVDGA